MGGHLFVTVTRGRSSICYGHAWAQVPTLHYCLLQGPYLRLGFFYKTTRNIAFVPFPTQKIAFMHIFLDRIEDAIVKYAIVCAIVCF